MAGHHPRQTTWVPLAPNGNINPRPVEEASKRKQPKSRNGCISCKARRRKCDETKPFCEQCTRRGLTCGGYPKFLKWREFGRKLAKDQPRSLTAYSKINVQSPTKKQAQQTSSPQEDDASTKSQGTASTSFTGHPSASAPTSTSSLSKYLGSTALSYGPSQPGDVDLEVLNANDIDGHGTSGTQQSNIDDAFFPTSRLSDESTSHSENLEFAPDVSVWDFFSHESLFDSFMDDDITDTTSQIPELDRALDTTFDSLVHYPEVPISTIQSEVTFLEDDTPESTEASAETIKHIFEQQTCEMLSIREDQSRNPWRTLIWPLASDYPALQYALAAMTCLHMCKSQPQHRLPGLRHFQASIRALAKDVSCLSAPLMATIATRLALGFAAGWDYENSSTGIDHINEAKALIRKAAADHRKEPLSGGDLSRLSFLANTCLYMDVIARLTCEISKTTNDIDFMIACRSLSSHIPSRQQIDPLMGCAITLFPMIGRLDELVGKVRKRCANRNSPAIISQAVELRTDIEQWTPSIELEGSGASELTHPILSDAIQTAEAYRWAALLLLRQAVPELPWRHSCWELASKTLIFIATVPLRSPTTIVQHFPLIAAGCEATDEDDRDWVRERWELMSKKMITGIVDRCKDITMEVWRRRDDFEELNDFVTRKTTTTGRRSSSSTTPPPPLPASGVNVSVVDFDTSSSSAAAEQQVQRPNETDLQHQRPGAQSPAAASDFPDTAAFKKGVDPVTRAGFMNYTVKGDLHWLGVMKDWNLEGK
ncbi:hypothetical protein PV08_07393 [Exophiala spinifera]|uniref:Zn(2)-C6 fungal-type domain-containing protein n=1 Tax=Exophiala spinifera TaxID=91928 RepID=A0A0D2BTP8_9EURO|nr:uncharacterized protein PV08_07393 [Exophiala spinifera]KIW14609.1 hypothetical protein PV08_07393 [Exophiala spinifera]